MDNSEVFKQLKLIDENCDICFCFKKQKPRPRVCSPLSKTFNECIVIDLKQIKNFWILHITRYRMAIIVRAKSADEVIEGIFKWISIFGRPSRILSDNGTEFNNHKFKELCSRVDITIHMTAVESSFSNGICERGNATIGKMTSHIMDDVGCSPEIALCWAVNAKNTLQNVYGYSPQQLVLGNNNYLYPTDQNINLPSRQSQLDLKAVYTYHVNDDQLEGLFLNHVDNFIVAGTDKFKIEVIEKIKEKFQISKHEIKMFLYVGLEISQHDHYVTFSQNTYSEKIKPHSIQNKESRQKAELLTKTETTDYRKLLGKLQ